jgi:hypothetical protein
VFFAIRADEEISVGLYFPLDAFVGIALSWGDSVIVIVHSLWWFSFA